MDIDSSISAKYALNRGLDRVFDAAQERPSLPDAGSLEPVEARASALESLLPASLSDELEEVVAKPVLTQKALIMPVQFKETLTSAIQQLQSETALQPDNEKILKRAVRLLGEYEEHLEVVQWYTTGLFQG